MKILCHTTLGILFLSTSLAVAKSAVRGSDFFADALRAPITQYAEQNGIVLDVDFAGSVPAVRDLRRGEASLAIVGIPDGQEIDDPSFVSIPFAFSVVVAAVNRDNPLYEISVRDLAGVFGRSAEMNLTRWGDLGLTDAWSARSIQPAVVSGDDHLLSSMVQHQVLGGGLIRPTVNRVGDSARLTQMVASEAGVIGLFPRRIQSDGVRELSLSDGGTVGAVAFGPSEENVYYGDYPLRLPFYLVFMSEDRDEVRDLLNFLLSDEVAQHLASHGFVAVPENLRQTIE